MSNFEVPFMPISSFDASEVLKGFSEESEENERESIESLMEDEDGNTFSKEIAFILIGMGMEKYVNLFKEKHILLDTFIELNESDLKEIGITNSEDIEIILKNLSIHQTIKNYCALPENHVEDVRIMKNISRVLLLLQNYCAYVELKMKKHKFTDYKVSSEESACTYLKAFTEAALIQSKKLSDTLYKADFDDFKDRILKVYNLVLPESFQKSQPRRRRKFCIYKVMVVVGLSSLIILTGKYIRKWEIL